MAVPEEDRSHGEKRKMTVSERSIPALTAALQDWLAGRAAGPGRPTVTGVGMPDSGGLSSTSVLFEASWPGEDPPRRGRYVARMAPEPSAVPVFPRYDLPAQFEVISRVAACCDIPLPALSQVSGEAREWQVPGRREELVTELIRSLPKDLRRAFVPAPDVARDLVLASQTDVAAL